MRRYLEWPSSNWADYSARRTTSADILFFLDTKFILVDPRPPGLRTGINMNGKTVRGLKSGEMRQHRLRSQEVDPSTRKPAVLTFFVTDFNN